MAKTINTVLSILLLVGAEQAAVRWKRAGLEPVALVEASVHSSRVGPLATNAEAGRIAGDNDRCGN